jgi:hypothetical protein
MAEEPLHVACAGCGKDQTSCCNGDGFIVLQGQSREATRRVYRLLSLPMGQPGYLQCIITVRALGLNLLKVYRITH